MRNFAHDYDIVRCLARGSDGRDLLKLSWCCSESKG